MSAPSQVRATNKLHSTRSIPATKRVCTSVRQMPHCSFNYQTRLLGIMGMRVPSGSDAAPPNSKTMRCLPLMISTLPTEIIFCRSVSWGSKKLLILSKILLRRTVLSDFCCFMAALVVKYFFERCWMALRGVVRMEQKAGGRVVGDSGGALRCAE